MIELFGEQITVAELTGTIFGIAGVWLTLKQKVLCFPVGIVNVALYSWLFFRSKLYSDAILQLVYIVLLIYGWYQWSRGTKASELTVTKTSKKLSGYLFLICILSTAAIGTFFRYNTNASLPYIDSLTTSMSLIAQWMIAKKKIENWIIWIVADIIYVCMYVFKHLYLTSFLYFIFIVLAVMGWLEWKKEMKTHRNN